MARLPAFFLPPERWRPPFELEGPEARHLRSVLRLEAGDEVRLLDGQGREGRFRVSGANRQAVRLEALEILDHPPQGAGVVLALGWNKSARRDWLLEKSVELGAAGLIFWPARRSEGRMPDAPKAAWTEKMLAAAKQCGASRLPELGVTDFEALAEQDVANRLVLWEETAPMLSAADFSATGRTLVVVGPEGGLERAEVERLQAAGFAPRSLGRAVLRWETAALAALVVGRLALEAA